MYCQCSSYFISKTRMDKHNGQNLSSQSLFAMFTELRPEGWAKPSKWTNTIKNQIEVQLLLLTIVYMKIKPTYQEVSFQHATMAENKKHLQNIRIN